MAAMCGCNRDTRTGLAKAADEAQRRLDRAASLLRDPVYKYAGEYAPLSRKVDRAVLDANDPNKLELLASGAVNEDVGKLLNQAEDELTKAIKEAGPKEPRANQNRALATLARVQTAKAMYNVFDAEKTFELAWDALGKVEMTAIEMADHGKRVTACDKLLATTDATLDAMATKAKEAGDAAKGKIADLTAKVDSLKKQRDEVTAENQKLLSEARALRVDSQLAPVLKSVELFDQAKVKEDKVAVNGGKIATIDDAIQAAKDDLSLLQLDANAADRSGAAAEGLANTRQQRKKELTEQRATLAKALAESQAQLEKFAGEAEAAAGAVAALRKKALASLELSLAHYDTYKEKTQPKDPRDQPRDISEAPNPDVISMHGDTFLARADVLMRSLALQARIERIVGAVRKLYQGLPEKNQAPGVLDQLEKFLPDGEKAKSTAIQDLRWAIKRYEDAVARVDRVAKWAYQLHIGGAYASLFRLAGDSDDRTKGLAALDSLGEQEGSPYIAPVAKHFRMVLSGTTGPAVPAAPAASAPADAPAAPAPN